MKKNLAIFVSAALAAGMWFVFGKVRIFLTPAMIYLLKVFLAMYFFAMLIAVQQGRGDVVSKTVRIVSAILAAFFFFFQLIYAPAARYIFSELIQKQFFLADLLALLLFLIFFFFFGLAAMLLASFSGHGFLSDWELYNSQRAFFVLGIFWLAAVVFSIKLYILDPFFIISVR